MIEVTANTQQLLYMQNPLSDSGFKPRPLEAASFKFSVLIELVGCTWGMSANLNFCGLPAHCSLGVGSALCEDEARRRPLGDGLLVAVARARVKMGEAILPVGRIDTERFTAGGTTGQDR